MTNLKLKSNTVKFGAIARECIEVYSPTGKLLCLIWSDAQLSPQAFEFELKEIEYFVHISKNFPTTFANLELLAMKDEVIKDQDAQIRQLQEEIQHVININPVNQA